MKKVTTNISFGQIVFILLVFCCSSLMFFYLGAKFGPRILGIEYASTNDAVLPDEKLALEVENILQTKNYDFVFHDVLQNEQQLEKVQPQYQEAKPTQILPAIPDPTKEALSEKKEMIENTKVLEIKKTIKEIPKMDLVKKEIDHEEPVHLDELIVPENKYRLQLGSYSKKKQALDSQSIWEKRGYDVAVVKTYISGKGNWYRLQVGFFPDMDSVQKTQLEFMTKYQQSSKIVSVK